MRGFEFRLCLSLSLSLSWSSGLRAVVCLLLICSAVEKCVFYIVFFFWSDQIGFSLLFFPRRSWTGRKILLIISIFWQISSTFRYALILCAETPFFHFEESLSTDNIQWMLSWAAVAIIIVVGDSPMTRLMDLPKENINQELSWLSGKQL